jgi:hypothetical protein
MVLARLFLFRPAFGTNMNDLNEDIKRDQILPFVGEGHFRLIASMKVLSRVQILFQWTRSAMYGLENW